MDQERQITSIGSQNVFFKFKFEYRAVFRSFIHQNQEMY